MNIFPSPELSGSLFLRPLRCGMAAVVSAVMMVSCEPDKKAAEAGAMGAPGGPVPAAVLTVKPAPLTLMMELPGRVSAFRVAEVRARVSGVVLKRYFEEGAEVKEGQLLYQIDPAPYEAELHSAEAQLARAEANAATTRLKAERYKGLLRTRGISQQDYDDAVAENGSFAADILSGKAAVETAKINLGYTAVTSPIDGQIGISEVTEGAYVRENDATLLATVKQTDPVYVDVTQSSADLLRLRRNIESGYLKPDAEGRTTVKLLMEDGSLYPEEGKLAVSDITVNQATSSVVLRAVFPNPRGNLLPGLFVRARMEEGSTSDAILVPQSAVTRNTRGEATTLVVGEGDMAEVRVIETPRSVGNQWLVSAGLKPGDRVIMDNLQKIRHGSPVKPVPLPAAADGVPETAASKLPVPSAKAS